MFHSHHHLDSAASIRRWVLVTTILASCVAFLDTSVITVALPVIEQALDTGLAGLQWIVDGYTIPFAALLILGGVLGDHYGRRRMMLVGLVGFGVAAVGCGMAPSLPWIIAGRVVQGIAAALLVPSSLAMIRAVFTEEDARGSAIGKWTAASGLVTIIGPVLGGWLVGFSWRWAFFLNVPLAALSAYLMFRFVPESNPEDVAGPPDWWGAFLLTLGLGGLAYTLIQAPVLGWRSPAIVVALTGGLGALLLFPFVEARVEQPLVPLHLFRSRNFTGANLTTLGVYFALTGTTFFLTLYLQNVVGYTPLLAGLAIAPLSLLLFLLSSLFGRWAGARGPRLFMTAGPLIYAGGLLWLSRLGPEVQYLLDLLPAVVVLGVGLAATVAPLTNTVMSSVAAGDAGFAAAFNNTVARVAGLLAVAGLGVVVSLTFGATLRARMDALSFSPNVQEQLEAVMENPTGRVDRVNLPDAAAQAVDTAYTRAFRHVMLVNALLAAAGGIVAALTIRREPQPEPPD